LPLLRSRRDLLVALLAGIGALALRGPLGAGPAVVASFAALIVPGLAVPGDHAPRLVAAAFTGAVALWAGKLWAALAVGMAVYWVLRASGFMA
jgi:hypothetical protein